MKAQQITPCLSYDGRAEEAANFYVSVFKDGKIHNITRYGKVGYEFHGQEEGTVMMVDFEINGQRFLAMNGGPTGFSMATSFQVICDSQDEIDYYWEKLSQGGEESMCGWLKDKFGLWWQIVPSILPQLMSDPEKSGKVMQAFLTMKKYDVVKLIEAANN